MKRIAVSGVGALIGYGIAKSLRLCGDPLEIIGLDTYPMSVGKRWCDFFEIVKPVDDPYYLENLYSILKKYNVDLFCPGIPQDVKKLYHNFHLVSSFPSKIVLNKYNVLDLSFDKWNTYCTLKENNFDTIPTILTETFKELSNNFGVPFLLKSRFGEASKGIYKIYDESDFYYYSKKLGKNSLFQKIIGNDFEEYTVGTFGLGDGTTNGMISFKRRLNYDGWTKEAFVIKNKILEDTVYKLVELLHPIGPTNFQFRFENGKYLLLEINARFSSSNSIRTAFGYNESKMCVDFYLHNKIPETVAIKNGYAVRYVEDFIVES